MGSSPIRKLFKILYSEYGPQHWWPAKTPFEVCVGAILTQNTSWKNVEKAISQMKRKGLIDCKSILDSDMRTLETAIMPAGFYKQKAKRLKQFCERAYFNALHHMSVQDARAYLLSIKGIGRETADSILLYAFNKPIFVIDAYTKRIYGRIFEGKYEGTTRDYDDLRIEFEHALGSSTKVFNEMHALLVEHAKRFCTKRNPNCSSCPVRKMCRYWAKHQTRRKL